MAATILDGRRIANLVRQDLLVLAAEDRALHGRPAGLVIARVGDEASSAVYTHALLRASERVGVAASTLALGADIDDAGLRGAIEALNADESVQGILIQLPLPPHLSQRTVAEAIDPRKDVDGISLRSAGNLFLRLPSFVPSTCAAVVEMLDRSQIELRGRRAVVVGASNVVGKPLAFTLLHRDATVTVCHIYTHDLAAWTRQADVLIAAAGKPNLITGDMVKPGATVIDVGINVRDDGSIVGDVEFESVAQVAGAITPVPGGVGQLTNLMLLKQTILARSLWHDDDGDSAQDV
ncbi:MAG: bifunctional 5,10-methylenetetrahydrofolate dehydrogenase/5,10-methenyltetrahydrofolate cyclohydrolase [Ktedonobacterales bacterium]